MTANAIEDARAVLAYMVDVVEPSLVDVLVDAPVDADTQARIIADLGAAIGKCADPVKRSKFTAQLRDGLSGKRTTRATVFDARDVQCVTLALRGLLDIVAACPNCSCSNESLPRSEPRPASLFGETTSAQRKTPAGGLSGSGNPDRPTSWQSSTGDSSGSKSKPPAAGSAQRNAHGATLASPPAGSTPSRSASTTPPKQSNKPADRKVDDWSWVTDRC